MTRTYVEIMIQSLRHKLEILDQIIAVNMKQKIALEDPELTPDTFDQLVEQKSELIEQLEQLDSGFENVFGRMKEELAGRREQYADQIRQMQAYIRQITDKSVEIQAQEARNKDLMVKKFSSIRQQARSVRTGAQVTNRYQQTMSKADYVDPQFMDTRSK